MSLFVSGGLVEEAYRKKIHNIIERIVSNRMFEDSCNVVKSYFEGHFPRFCDGINLAHKHVHLDSNSLILEYGSPVPYFSLPFVTENNCKAVCRDIRILKFGEIQKNIVLEHGNICTDQLAPSSLNLIIMTEVWEHLPCSLLKAKAKVLNYLKNGGYLLCSFPIKGANSNPDQWDKILDTDFESNHDHLREFTPKTITQFITELEILGSTTSYTRAYGGNIVTVLYRKQTRAQN
jgi:hypothetical protein